MHLNISFVDIQSVIQVINRSICSVSINDKEQESSDELLQRSVFYFIVTKVSVHFHFTPLTVCVCTTSSDAL